MTPSTSVMAELQGRVRERVRADLVRHGASSALEDPALFAEIDAMLRAAIDRSQPAALLLPELLGDPSTWRLETAIKYQTHRGTAGAPIMFVKQRLLMPAAPLVLRIQPRQLRAAAPHQPGAVRVRPGAGHRN